MADGTPRAQSTPTVLSAAVREAARFERRLVSLSAGLLAALPVVVVMAIGIGAGSPVAGVTMGAGAMLVGIAWRIRGGRAPLGLMATDAVVMALSTFLGCVTGSVEWLHLVLLCVWSLLAGLMVALGPGGAVVGTQALLAALIFGRFSQPAASALGLAGLVLAGGGAQVLVQAVLRWPPPLRFQRAAVARAYRALAELAREPPGEGATLSAVTALDEAERDLAAPALFGDPALMTLRSLVNEGQRIRVQLAAIRSLLGHGTDGAAGPGLDSAARALELAARAIEGDEEAGEELERWAEKRPGAGPAPPASAPAAPAASPTPAPVALPLARRVAALGGQLRAVAALAPAAGSGGGLRSRRPLRGDRPLARLRSGLATLRANASLSSPAGRHALRLAVVVVGAELLSRHIPLQRSYWMVVAAATTLRPEFGATFTRGTERALGTCLGVALAGAITVGLHPAGAATIVLVGVLACAAYAVFPASFAAGFGFITAVVVFLLNAVSPDTLATAWARLVDTLIGGVIGLAVYALWPSWAREPARAALANLVAAQRAYSDRVLRGVTEGRRIRADDLRPLSRRARLARTQAESAVAVSLSEPQTRQIDADQTRGAFAALRRLVFAVHALRLDAEEDRAREPLPALASLVEGVDRLLAAAETALRDEAVDPGALPDLRAAYEAFERVAGVGGETGALLPQLDEIVDAVNSLAAVLGLEPADAEPAAAASRSSAARFR